MSKIIRSPKGRLALLTLIVAGVAISVAFIREAQAAPYVNPFWTSSSISQESAIDMVAERAMLCESVDAIVAGGVRKGSDAQLLCGSAAVMVDSSSLQPALARPSSR